MRTRLSVTMALMCNTTISFSATGDVVNVANGLALVESDGKLPASIIPAGGGAAWGGITGTLSEQTDIQSALDAKATGTGTASGTNTGDQTTVSGNAGTATALAANGGNCSGNEFALGVNASGVGECAQPGFSNLSGAATDAQVPNTITVDLAATVTTNANLTGDVTSSGNATTIADNSVDGTDIAIGSDAQGDVMYYDGTNWVRLAKGAAGQVLEMNAGATAPEWDADDGGGGASWGSITGTLSSQSDLNTALTGKGYTLGVQALTSSPTDAQTVYFGQLPKAPVTAAATSKVYIPRTGTVKRAQIYCYSGTAGTAENWSLYVRLNNTTDTLIETLGAGASERIFNNESLSIAVSAGDYIEIKGIQPTWATNPLTTIYGGYVYIE